MPVKTDPKVSVIMPASKGEKHLSASIKSILSQTYRNLELLIINGTGATDIEETVRTFINRDSRIKYFVTKKQGAAAAKNIGLKAADGEWIAYQVSGDMAAEDRIERCLNFALKKSERCLVYGGWFRFSAEKDRFRVLEYLRGYQNDFDVYSFQQKNQFACSSVMHHKDCLIKSGLFDENLKYDDDWDMWLRISDDFPVYLLDEAVVYRRIGQAEDGPRAKTTDKAVAENRRIITEKRIKKLLGVYSSAPDPEIAKKIFFACKNINEKDLKKEVLERLESWRVFNTITKLVKTTPRQAFELLERHQKDKFISYLIREKEFDFSFPVSGLTNEDMNFIKKVLASVVIA